MCSRPDNIDLEHKVIEILLDESKRESSYTLIQKLTAKFADYIEDEKIAVPSELLAALKSNDAGYKLGVIKLHLWPKQRELASLIQSQTMLKPEQLAKCLRYLNAMIDVATA